MNPSKSAPCTGKLFRGSLILLSLLTFFRLSALAQDGVTMATAFPIPVGPCASYYTDYQNNSSASQFLDSYGQPSPEVYYKIVVPAGGRTVTVSLCGSSFDTYLSLLDVSGNLVDFNDDSGPLCTGYASSMEIALGAGTYYIVAEGYSANTGDLTVEVNISGSSSTPGSGMANAVNAGTFSSSGSYTDIRNNGDACQSNTYGQPSPDITYRFTLTGPADVVLSHCGSGFDTYMHLLDAGGSLVAFNDDSSVSPCPGNQAYIASSLPAGTYYVVSEGYGSSTGDISTSLTVTMAPPPAVPSISYSVPGPLTVGTPASLSPVNTGGAVFSGTQSTSTFAGSGTAGFTNGTGTGASFSNPISTAADASGNIYVADAGNHSVRKITPAGVVSTLAGLGYSGYADGNSSVAKFTHPTYLAVDANGNVFVSDQQNHRIRKITPAGAVSTFAGSGSAGFANGTGTGASFQYPMGLAFDASGNLYVADAYNDRIRKITPAGAVSTFAGSGANGSADGATLSASFNRPMGLAFDPSGNLYIADRAGQKVRKIDVSGTVTTLAGSGSIGYADGTGTVASFNYVNGVALDAQNNIYVADYLNNMVRKVTPAGVVTTFAGTTTAATVDGTGSAVRFNSVYGITAGIQGEFYITENAGNRVRKMVLIKPYSVSPSLPAGLVFSGETGAISGVPTAVSPATVYTVTARNSAGNGTAAFTLEVKAALQCPVPSADQNYVLSYTVREEGLTTAAAVESASCDPARVQTAVSYFDGLGRPLQSVQVKGSADGTKDIITPVAYDAYGREYRKYLPYAGSGTAGSYRAAGLSDVTAYYQNQPAGLSTAFSTPFSETVFEASPLNRILEQGAPGAAWQPVPNSTAGHTVKMDYSANSTGEVLLWEITSTGASAPAAYPAGRLYKTVTKDENWTSGKGGTVEEFKDLEGRVVLKRTWQDESTALSTYYVYDDFGNLRYVLPPAVTASSFAETDAVFENYIYAYRYDGRKRLIQKKIPGMGWAYMVYNKLDQVVLSQDANQRLADKWLFTKYDAFGRPVMTGITASSKTRAQWQADIDAQTILWENRDDANAGTSGTGYTNLTLPSAGISSCLTLNYYDDYGFYGNSMGIPNGTTEVSGGRTKGLATGTKVNILGTPDFLLTVSYYDAEGRVIRTKGENHLNGTDEVLNTYSFSGELLTSKRTHSSVIASVAKGAVIENQYSYDHMGRKVSTKENIDGQGWVTLNRLEYNEIGQLKQKNLHSTDGTNFLQNTIFAYNERGWLKNSVSNEFKMQLDYHDGTVPQYNGNISNQRWGSTLGNVYSYGYDKLNRLTNGTSTGITMSEALTYDVMGNIASLNRDGAGAKTYTYKNGGNQLESVDGVTTTNYAYDANGNATTDGRNGISLTYNLLNLPQTAAKTGLNLSYSYDATGRKLKKTSITAGTNTTDYAGGIQYTNGNIEFIQTEEGVARKIGTNYIYEYNLSDHLGNVRYTFGTSGGTLNKLQTDDYYPFGKRKSSFANANDNKYLYNGKELQDELGEQYDYGARFYDPVIGRWNVVDPLAEKGRRWSPYRYGYDNPIRFIDPDGMLEDWVKTGDDYLWDDRVIDQETAEQYQGKNAQYVGQVAEVTPMKSDGTAVGATVSLNGDGTVTRDGITLGINSGETFTNAAGSEFTPRQTHGSYYGLSVNFAFGGGFGFGLGYVKDAVGDGSFYGSGSANIGFGLGAGFDLGKTNPTDLSKQFYVDDFAGKGASYSAGISTPIVDFGSNIGGSLGLPGALLNPNNFGKNVNGYTTDQASISPGTGAGFSIMYSNSTTVLFGRKK